MLRRHNDLVGDQEGGVESHPELADQIAEFGGAARLLRYPTVTLLFSNILYMRHFFFNETEFIQEKVYTVRDKVPMYGDKVNMGTKVIGTGKSLYGTKFIYGDKVYMG